MQPKKCKHLLREEECWLCQGNPRSKDARDYAESVCHIDLLHRFKESEREIFMGQLWDILQSHESGDEE